MLNLCLYFIYIHKTNFTGHRGHGTCPETGSFIFNEQLFEGYIQTATVWGSVTQQDAKWSPTTEQIFLGEDGTQVGNYEFESFVNSDGTTVWDKTYYRKCEETLREVYHGPGKLYAPKNNGSQILVMDVAKLNIFFALDLQKQLGICGRHGFATQIEGVTVLLLQKYDRPIKITHVSPKEISLYDNLL